MRPFDTALDSVFASSRQPLPLHEARDWSGRAQLGDKSSSPEGARVLQGDRGGAFVRGQLRFSVLVSKFSHENFLRNLGHVLLFV